MDINERLVVLRKSLKLSETEFGKKVGVSRSVINNIDCFRVDASEKPLLLSQICTVYNVNESWLLHGEGEMFNARSREDELIDMFGALLADDDTFRRRFITALAQLDEAGWEAVAKFCEKVVKNEDGES